MISLIITALMVVGFAVVGWCLRKLDHDCAKLRDDKASAFRLDCLKNEVKDLSEKLYAMERHVGVSLTYNPLPEKYSYVKKADHWAF
jgi:hypothetical protein